MNYVIAKIKGKNEMFEKLYSGDAIYKLPTELEGAIEYSASTILEDNEWFKVELFSKTDYCIELIKEEFNTTNFSEADKVRNEKIEYIISYQDGNYFFQRIFKNSIMQKKRITLGDNVKLDSGEKCIVVNDIPDAIYIKETDVMYFKKLTTVVVKPFCNSCG